MSEYIDFPHVQRGCTPYACSQRNLKTSNFPISLSKLPANSGELVRIISIMKKGAALNAFCLFTLVVLATSVGYSQNEIEVRESITATMLPGSAFVFLSEMGGNVSIEPGQPGRCDVEIVLVVSSDSYELSSEYAESVRHAFRPTEIGLHLETFRPPAPSGVTILVSYRVRVPVSSTIICRLSSGDVEVIGLAGYILEIVTSNSDIYIRNCPHEVVFLENSFGSIKCEGIAPSVLNIKNSYGPIRAYLTSGTLPQLQALVANVEDSVELLLENRFSGTIRIEAPAGQIRLGSRLDNVQTGPGVISGRIGVSFGKIQISAPYGSVFFGKVR